MGHQHSHDHDHTKEASERALKVALVLTGVYLVVQAVAGFVTNSLALLADAAHMLTDVAALAIALIAIRLGRRLASLVLWECELNDPENLRSRIRLFLG